jgi:hypothetical protein
LACDVSDKVKLAYGYAVLTVHSNKTQSFKYSACAFTYLPFHLNASRGAAAITFKPFPKNGLRQAPGTDCVLRNPAKSVGAGQGNQVVSGAGATAEQSPDVSGCLAVIARKAFGLPAAAGGPNG